MTRYLHIPENEEQQEMKNDRRKSQNLPLLGSAQEEIQTGNLSSN
jgi:hypothetical protein